MASRFRRPVPRHRAAAAQQQGVLAQVAVARGSVGPRTSAGNGPGVAVLPAAGAQQVPGAEAVLVLKVGDGPCRAAPKARPARVRRGGRPGVGAAGCARCRPAHRARPAGWSGRGVPSSRPAPVMGMVCRSTRSSQGRFRGMPSRKVCTWRSGAPRIIRWLSPRELVATRAEGISPPRSASEPGSWTWIGRGVDARSCPGAGASPAWPLTTRSSRSVDGGVDARRCSGRGGRSGQKPTPSSRKQEPSGEGHQMPDFRARSRPCSAGSSRGSRPRWRRRARPW